MTKSLAILSEKSKQLLKSMGKDITNQWPVSEKTLARAFVNARLKASPDESDLKVLQEGKYAAKLIAATKKDLFIPQAVEALKSPYVNLKDLLTGTHTPTAQELENERLLKLAEGCGKNDMKAIETVRKDLGYIPDNMDIDI
jgi:hypothetical protein